MRDSERKEWTKFAEQREAEREKKKPRPKKEPQPTQEEREAALDDLTEDES
jgi:hypothetical protein